MALNASKTPGPFLHATGTCIGYLRTHVGGCDGGYAVTPTADPRTVGSVTSSASPAFDHFFKKNLCCAVLLLDSYYHEIPRALLEVEHRLNP